jgi:SAM-dependent methyltransferase
MTTPAIRFEDGALYERTMGVWSRLAGAVFLDWLAPAPGLRWADIGCGNGAFTELLVQRCAPASVHGIDPSPQQLAYARQRPGMAGVTFTEGDAQALPFPDAGFDAAVMALVIFFVPDPARGVAEMARVVRPGGLVAAYAWDMFGGGFPFRAIPGALRELGQAPTMPPSVEASRLDRMTALWTGAGLQAVETRTITVERGFANFEEFWAANTATQRTRDALAALPPGEAEALKARLRQRLPAAADGRIVYAARANAVRGRVPG